MLVNPIHKFPRPIFLVGNFLNFEVEEKIFSILLNCFQSSNLFEDLYILRSLLQLVFHQLLKCTMMLTTFEFFVQILSDELVNLLTMLSRWAILSMLAVLMFLINSIISLIKVCSSLLFLTIVCFFGLDMFFNN